MRILTLLSTLLVSLCLTISAQASEVRIGLWNHDVELLGEGGDNGKETGTAISLDYVANSRDWLKPIYSPRPYVGGSLNLDGNTSHIGAGLLWQKDLTPKFYGNFGFGLAVHDGTIQIPDQGFPPDLDLYLRLRERERNEIEFGSRVLFRSQLSLGIRLSDVLSTELSLEHLSHGGLVSSVNEGADNLGLRFTRKIG